MTSDGRQELIDAFLGGLTVSPSQRALLVTVSYSSTDPEFAAKAAVLPQQLPRTADDLRAVRSPVLILLGDRDFVRVDHAARMQELLPDARLAVLPNTTHMGLTERADLVLPLVEEFLGRAVSR